MTTVILDVDGVLLNWREPFNNWLVLNHFVENDSIWKEADYQFDKVFLLEPKYIRNIIDIFDETHFISKLPPIPGAVKAVEKLYRAGYTLKVATAFSSNYESMKMREENLHKIFGDVFHEIYATGNNISKKGFLAQQPKGSIFVDDVYEHIVDAYDVGFERDKLYLFPQPWNYEDWASIDTDKFSRIHWKGIINNILGE